MARRAAGVLLFRRPPLEVLIVHPGGPYWARKDLGAWSLPKGELEAEDEDPRQRALTELAEETGLALDPDTPLLELGDVRLKSGKRITAFAAEGDFAVETLVSNEFEVEWPPRSGRRQSFPEVDRALWLAPEDAMQKLHPVQAEFIERLQAAL